MYTHIIYISSMREGGERKGRGGRGLIYFGDFSLFLFLSFLFFIFIFFLFKLLILCTGPNWGMMSLLLWVACFFIFIFRVEERVSLYLLRWA